MAGLRYRANLLETSIGTTKATMIQIVAPANQGLLIHAWSVSFKGTGNSDDPGIQVTAERQSTAGTSGSALTFDKENPNDSSTIQATGQQNITGTQPTKTGVHRPEEVRPDGFFTWTASFYEKPIRVMPGERFGIAVLAGQANSMTGYVDVEE